MIRELVHISLFATILFSAALVLMPFRLLIEKTGTEIQHEISLEQIDGAVELQNPCYLKDVYCDWKFIAPVTKYLWTGYRMSNGEFPKEGYVACPRKYVLNSRVEIDGEEYICGDHTAKKYDGRFDIFTGESYSQALKWGKRELIVMIK